MNESSPSSDSLLPSKVPSLNEEVIIFGSEIFQAIRGMSPSLLSKKYWSGKLMGWSMNQPLLKKNLFQLVDVLPSLTSSASVVDHLQQYLGSEKVDLGNPLLNRGLSLALSTPPRSLRAKIIASAVRRGVKEMASQFIAGTSAKHASSTLRALRSQKIAYTIDLLGEYSVSEKEAQVYAARYLECLSSLGPIPKKFSSPMPSHPGERSPHCVSIKLSALYSQMSMLNRAKSVETILVRLAPLLKKALENRTLVYFDAEDTSLNPIIYDLFKRVAEDPDYKDLPLLGAVVQCYQKNALSLLDSIIEIGRNSSGPTPRFAVRLVKGAYWDSETTLARSNGWESPLFTEKWQSDENFERCVDLLLSHTATILPAFASHNIRSLSYACMLAKKRGISVNDFELQMLYGMAEPIAHAFAQKGYLVRMYVPLGELIPGMGYLVRRLLENTSNESFLRHTFVEERERHSLLSPPGPVTVQHTAR
jgi:RHH-type transcriptional regulator, proline utilization regulon repressor / proline dehydrogenase / delta 1-pyrroline-5-carboxylate dehydrogenase